VGGGLVDPATQERERVWIQIDPFADFRTLCGGESS